MSDQGLLKLGYFSHLIFSCSLFIFFFTTKHQVNWIAGSIRELLTMVSLIMYSIYIIIYIGLYIKSKNRKTLIYGGIGLIPLILSLTYFDFP